MVTFEYAVPGPDGTTQITFKTGTTTVFVGANGSGKTRLAVKIETFCGAAAHRISAHRALTLNPSVTKTSMKQAFAGLRGMPIGREFNDQRRSSTRWGGKAETALLNDFDLLLQALFAEQSNVEHDTHVAAHAGTLGKPSFTKFQKMQIVWERVLPLLTLVITGDDIEVSADNGSPYSAAEMSDGERAVFYMLGQVLVAEPDSVLIFDEPELHVHRAILGRLWDEIEAARPDCAFVLITHDLEFAASRPGQKFAIRSYSPQAGWALDVVQEDETFSEEMATLILGSRKPILFVEGNADSVDRTLYRTLFPDWTPLPRGACDSVIHSVSAMRANQSLTRVTCAGILDRDGRTGDEVAKINRSGVAVLPVAEIENLFLLPRVSEAIATTDSYTGSSLQAKARS